MDKIMKNYKLFSKQDQDEVLMYLEEWIYTFLIRSLTAVSVEGLVKKMMAQIKEITIDYKHHDKIKNKLISLTKQVCENNTKKGYFIKTDNGRYSLCENYKKGYRKEKFEKQVNLKANELCKRLINLVSHRRYQEPFIILADNGTTYIIKIEKHTIWKEES